MTSELFEAIVLSYLRLRKGRSLRRQLVVDANEPIRLLEEYRSRYENHPECLQELAFEVTGKSTAEERPSLTRSKAYQSFKARLEQRLHVFDNKPYQLGALDVEIDVVVSALEQLRKPDVLEIGVGNGYSSAFLYFALSKIGGTLTSIDLPRFSSEGNRLAEVRQFPDLQLRRWLAGKGKIENTGTLGDLNPGGVIPAEKYAGWLVPMELRRRVRNTTIYGSMFKVLPYMPDAKFHFVVFDAVKPYEARIRAFELIVRHLHRDGICVVDGYWANQAFADFCRQWGWPTWHAGRIGLFVKRMS